jgi:zinc protease
MRLRRLVAISTCIANAASAQSAFDSEIRDLKFANGMQAVIARTPPIPGRAPRVFVGLYLRYGVATGARPELAHLVEHIGANNRPTLVNYAVPANLTTFGGNAMTRPDFMSFWRTIAPEGLAEIVPNRANRVAGVLDDSAVFAREVGRVAAESERAITRIAARGFEASDILAEAFFGPLPSLEQLVDSIRHYDRPTVFSQISEYFRPDNALLVVAGDINIDSASAIVRKHLDAYPARRGPGSKTGAAFASAGAPIARTDARADRVRLGIGFPAPPRDGADYLAFMILEQFLLGGRQLASDSASVRRSMDSPLGKRLRSELNADSLEDGVYYSTDPPLLAFRSPTFTRAFVSFPPRLTADEIAARTRRAIASATSELTDAAIASAKRELIGFLGRWMLSPDLLHLGDHLAAFAFIEGEAARLTRLPAEIEAVPASRVRAAGQRLAAPGGSRIAMVLPARR